MKLYAKDSGVSPVIGTILLVAITVVLVAIIAAVIMGMAGDVNSAKQVGITVDTHEVIHTSDPFDSEVTMGLAVRVMGGKDVANLRSLTVSVEGAHGKLPYLGAGGEPTSPSTIMKRSYESISSSEVIGLPLYYLITPAPGEYEGQTDYGGDEFGYYPNALVTVTGIFADGTEVVLYKKAMTIMPKKIISGTYGTLSLRNEVSFENSLRGPIIGYELTNGG